MDTKLRAESGKFSIYHWSVKLFIFVVMTAALAVALLQMAKLDDVIFFLGGEKYARQTLSEDVRYKLYYNINRVHFRDELLEDAESNEKAAALAAELKEGKKKGQIELDKYAEQGIYYFTYGDYKGEDVQFTNASSLGIKNYDDFTDYFSSEKHPDRYIYAEGGAYKFDKSFANFYIGFTEKATATIFAEIDKPIKSGTISFYTFLFGLIIFLAGIVVSCAAAGRKERGGELSLNFFNHIYNDIFTVAYGILCGFAVWFYGTIWGVIWSSFGDTPFSDNFLKVLTILLAVGFSGLSFWYFTTMAKWAKAGMFFKHTLIYNVYMLIKKIVTYPFKVIFNKNLKRDVVISTVTLFITVLLNVFVTVLISASNKGPGIALLWGLFTMSGLVAAYTVFVYRKFADFDEIKQAISEIRGGNLSFKMPPNKNGELNAVADDINHIGEGLQAALKTATISEKMKTELITNVSHDLKTPLTSIISYIELLSEDESLSPEARDYVNVLKTKSEGLKNIISDLFELSKGASGNIDVNIERLDLKRLIEQTLGDMGDRVAASGKTIKEQLVPENAFILADGKRLYRVFQNIIDNALKYSLDGTRIFVKLNCADGKATAEIINTASYEMDFSETEVIERFSRGDTSRSTEGSGLGLSIAKTFTEICGGQFSVKIDGDMFKALVEFELLN